MSTTTTTSPRGRPRRVLSPDEVREACARYRSGEGLRAVALSLRTGYATARAALVTAGVPLRPKGGQRGNRGGRQAVPISPEQARRIVVRYGRGESLREIVAVETVPYSAVRRVLLDAQVPLRDRRGRHHGLPQPAARSCGTDGGP